MKFNDFEYSTQVILKIIFAAAVLTFLWLIREVVVVLLLAIILASALDPLVNYLQQHRVPRSVSVIAVYIFVLGLVGLVFYSIIPLLVAQFKILVSNLPAYSENFQARFGQYVGSFQLGDLVSQFVSGGGGASNVVHSTFGIFNGVISAISVLVISFYLVAEKLGMQRFVTTFAPAARREFIGGLLDKIQRKMGLWILGQVIASVIMFLITWFGLSLLHIQYALVLAVIAGLLEVVPYIGPIVSAFPAMFFGLVQGGAPLALGVAVLYFLLHELEGYVLIPKIMEKTVGGSPLVILLAVLIGYKLAGVVGIVIAVPLVGALNVVLQEFWPGKTA